ncbi:hypothetical protein GQ457_06G024020 [Hibiscus cannabinus]
MEFAAVSFALKTIRELTQQVTPLLGVDDQVESLETELRWMQSFLMVADARKVNNEVIRTCVAEIRELAYDAEDVIETFALKVASNRKCGFSNSACFLKQGCLIYQTKSKIERITDRIKVLTRRLKTYDVAKLGGHGEGPSSSTERDARRPFPHRMDDNIVGMEGDIRKLVSVLVVEESECRVVSISGMGGLGKTTLAKKIYHHNRVIGHFNHLVWVYVSQQCQRRKVWEEILSGLKKLNKDERKKRDEDLATELYEFLKDEKCLVVLDDIWSTEAWDILKPAFPVEPSSNNKILITSRNKEIVSHADRRGHLHELQCLSDEQSWDLFQKIAFPRTDPTENRVDAKLKELGEEMVKHCAGLPLAIVVLGGILVTKDNSFTEWLKVSANVKSYLKRVNSQGPEDVLALSYDDLPPYLRPCFLYLSHFPEDYVISADRLIQLWVAEGIISSKQEERDGGEIAEDVAEHCLMELVERCMIQVRKRDLKIKTIHMHDLMRDLCLSKAKQESFGFIVDQSNASSLSIIPKVRRVSLHKFFWIQSIKSPNLRSLLFFDEFIEEEAVQQLFPKTMHNYARCHEGEHSNPLLWIVTISLFGVALGVVLPKILGVWQYMCNNFKLLRVLNYEGRFNYEGIFDDEYNFAGCRLPTDISNLIHLRFLSLKGLEFLWGKLPSSLGNLRCLQTLDLRIDYGGFNSIHVPNVIWRMEQLRHLYLPMKCNRKTKLKLATLRNLQTLVNFNSKICRVEDLIYMKNLRELVIRGSFKIEDFNDQELDKNSPIIEGMHLHSLSIISNRRIDPRHLNLLLSSCLNLCKLSLDVWIKVLSKMTEGSSAAKPFTNKSISIRLDNTNYLLWRQQVLFTIESLALDGHVDGTLLVPSQYVLGEGGAKVSNPEYVSYKQQDSALCSWLLSSIGTSILPSLVNCKTALDIWTKVQSLFSVSSTTRIMHLHCSLKSLRKRDQSMGEYLSQIQSICDNLAACGNPLTETMHISAILSGLPPEFEPVVAVITSSQQPYKLEGVCSVLLDTESRQQEFLNQASLVNLAQGPNQSGVRQGPYSSQIMGHSPNSGYFGTQNDFTRSSYGARAFSPQRNYQDSFNSHRVGQDSSFRPQSNIPGYSNRVSSFRGGRGYGGRSYGGRARPQCQLCGRIGHLVNRCFFRFDHSFDGVINTANLCYSEEVPVDQSLVQEEHEREQNGGIAMLAEDINLSGYGDAAWYPDSGATTHITPDAGMVSNSKSYFGAATVSVANGMSAAISKIGTASLNTVSRPLVLNNLLHVPAIKKNLLSVSKFTKDNNVSIEFYHDSCVVKDLATQQVILQGLENDGLYKFSSSSCALMASADFNTGKVDVSTPAANSSLSSALNDSCDSAVALNNVVDHCNAVDSVIKIAASHVDTLDVLNSSVGSQNDAIQTSVVAAQGGTSVSVQHSSERLPVARDFELSEESLPQSVEATSSLQNQSSSPLDQQYQFSSPQNQHDQSSSPQNQQNQSSSLPHQSSTESSCSSSSSGPNSSCDQALKSKKIKMRYCMLEEDPMPTLEKLPNLRILKLHEEALRTNKIFCSAQGFPKLESLKLKKLSGLEEWNVDEGAMPCLRRLEMERCGELKMIPDGLSGVLRVEFTRRVRFEDHGTILRKVVTLVTKWTDPDLGSEIDLRIRVEDDKTCLASERSVREGQNVQVWVDRSDRSSQWYHALATFEFGARPNVS